MKYIYYFAGITLFVLLGIFMFSNLTCILYKNSYLIGKKHYEQLLDDVQTELNVGGLDLAIKEIEFLFELYESENKTYEIRLKSHFVQDTDPSTWQEQWLLYNSLFEVKFQEWKNKKELVELKYKKFNSVRNGKFCIIYQKL